MVEAGTDAVTEVVKKKLVVILRPLERPLDAVPGEVEQRDIAWIGFSVFPPGVGRGYEVV